MTVRTTLLIPVLLLLVAFIGAAIALLADRRNARLEDRVAAVIVRQDAGSLARLDIRAADAQGPRGVRWLLRLLRVPVDLPAAHVISPRLVWAAGAIVVVATSLLASGYVSWPLAIGVGFLLGMLLLRTVFGWERSRYRNLLTRQLPDAIDLVISAVRAGLPVSEAFRAIANEMPAPTKVEIGRVVNEMSLGVTAEDALLAVHRRTRVREYAIFAVTIGVQAKSGGRLSEIMRTLGETVRQRLALAARARALSSEVRFSAFVLAALPFVAIVFLRVMQPHYFDPLFTDPRGLPLMITGASGVLLGIGTMRLMIAQAVSE